MNLIRTALIVVCSLLATTAHAAWVNIDELHANNLPPGTSGIQFGKSIAADVRADGAIRALYVGAPYATVEYQDVTYPGAGKVYFLVWNGTQLVTSSFFSAIPQANAHFGSALAARNGTIVVGEPDFDDAGHPDSGKVHIIYDEYWHSTTLIYPFIRRASVRTIGVDNARLGSSVAVDGDGVDTTTGSDPNSDGSYIAAGASNEAGTGCAYGWHLPVNTQDNVPVGYMGRACAQNSGESFGSSVAVRSTAPNQIILVAGAPGSTQGGNVAAGAAYVHVRVNNNLVMIDTLLPPNPALLDVFGTSVGIDDDYIYVGAAGRDLAGVGRTGSVSIFTPANLLGYDFLTERFPAPPRNAGDLCGASLTTNFGGSGIVLGCPGSDGSVVDQGAARVITPFNLLGNLLWLDQLVTLADEPHGADDLGRSAVLVNGRVYAGAPFADDTVGVNNGGVFEFASGIVGDNVFANGFE